MRIGVFKKIIEDKAKGSKALIIKILSNQTRKTDTQTNTIDRKSSTKYSCFSCIVHTLQIFKLLKF